MDADPALGSAIAEAVEAEPDRARRSEMLTALARPKDEVAAGSVLLVRLFTRSCDAARRDEARRYVTQVFAPLPGGTIAVTQMLEEMDQCILARARLEPQIRAWLGSGAPALGRH